MAGDSPINSGFANGNEPCAAMPIAHDEATNESGCVSATRLAVAPTHHAQTSESEAIAAQARSIGHDLNNVLAIMTSYTLLVLEVLEADDPSRADLEEVCVAAERACHLVRQLSLLGHPRPSATPPT